MNTRSPVNAASESPAFENHKGWGGLSCGDTSVEGKGGVSPPELANGEGVTETTASALDGNAGGLPETIVPNAEVQIDPLTIEVLPEGFEF